MQNLIGLFASLHPLSQYSKDLLAANFEEQQYKKGEIILDFKQVCHHLHFIRKGLVRTYFLEDGEKITDCFGSDNEVINSMHSFIDQTPSIVAIEALEETTLLSISYEALQNLYVKSQEINSLGRIILEKNYIALQAHHRLFKTKTAGWLYKQLITDYPTLVSRVSLGHIASYLGISKEQLSRIRTGK